MANFESIQAFYERCIDGNVSQTDFLRDMSDYIDTNHPNVTFKTFVEIQ